MRIGKQASPTKNAGFTLVEIMIVVVLILLLGAIVLPAFVKVRMQTQNAAVVNDMRIFRAAFELYNLEWGVWPPDTNGNRWPSSVRSIIYSDYIQKEQWEKRTPIGGVYDWDPGVFHNSTGISVYQPTVSNLQLQMIDSMIDDGVLTTGMFRTRPQGVIWIMEFN